MGIPLRVIPNHPSYKIHALSRINFYRPYTVEYNVKVFDFGKIDEKDHWKLKSQFARAWYGIGRTSVKDNL